MLSLHSVSSLLHQLREGDEVELIVLNRAGAVDVTHPSLAAWARDPAHDQALQFFISQVHAMGTLSLVSLRLLAGELWHSCTHLG